MALSTLRNSKYPIIPDTVCGGETRDEVGVSEGVSRFIRIPDEVSFRGLAATGDV
ncbi:MAG TPA: hypothetical protein VNZ58_12240 [Thermomicrobiales bacterium]|nr:hypothetical protein [Thermomicrobiales bacterium]